jgi:hypothetical protein
MSEHFTQYAVADFEYETSRNGIFFPMPIPLCMVAYLLDENLRHVRTISMWREQLLITKDPPFDIGPYTLFGAYSAWAEMTCFMVRGWPFPKHIFDLHTAYLAISNMLPPWDQACDESYKKPGKGLADACRTYGIKGWENIEKKTVAKDIGEGRWQKYGQQYVFDYCEEDVKNSTELLRAMIRGDRGLPAVNVNHILHWSNYSAKCIAPIQSCGIPWDTELWDITQANNLNVIRALCEKFDPSFYDKKTYGRDDDGPIYNENGEFSYKRFEHHLAQPCYRPGFERPAVVAWPRLSTGKLDTHRDAFRLMSHIKGMNEFSALRDAISFIAKATLPISSDGRNRPSLFPFGTATGRNAHSKSPYNAHAGVRSFIKFPAHKYGVYLDWRTQEVGILAAESGCEPLKAAYRSGDVYHGFAYSFGMTNETDRKIWKANCSDMRDRMKRLTLAINYGMGVLSLAKGLDRHPIIASGILQIHRRTYPRSWQYREERVQAAFLDRHIMSKFGWPLWLTHSPNERTLYNFPMQANGAEMLRLAVMWLCEAGLVPVMLVHDGILFEFDSLEQIDHAIEIMLKAGRAVCDGFDIGVDIDQKLIGGERYMDKRPLAKKMWKTIMYTLEAVGAIPRRA